MDEERTAWPLLQHEVAFIDVIGRTTSASTTGITSSTSAATSRVVIEGSKETSAPTILVTSRHSLRIQDDEIGREYNDTDEQAEHRRRFNGPESLKQDYQSKRKDE